MPPLIDLLLRVVSFMGLKVDGLSFVIKSVVLYYLPDNFPDVLFVGHLLKQSGDSIQLSVRLIIIPTDARNGVLWLEHERNG